MAILSDLWRNYFQTPGQASGTTTSTTQVPKPVDEYGIDSTASDWDWADSGRKEKMGWYHSQVNEVLRAGGTEANKLYNMEEARGQRAEDIVGKAAQDANKPTMTDQDIRRQFGQSADASGEEMLGKMSGLRAYLGGAGVTGGGLAAGMAAQYQLARSGQMTDARRALFLEKSKTDALDRAANFQRQMAYASAVNRPVSMIRSDWLNNMAGIRLGQQANEIQRSAAKDAANAAKEGGMLGAIGGIGGALIGAVL